MKILKTRESLYLRNSSLKVERFPKERMTPLSQKIGQIT